MVLINTDTTAMQENEILPLIEKYLAGTATPEEETKLLGWYRHYDHSEIEVRLDSEKELNEINERILQKLKSHISETRQAEIVPLIERSFRKKKIYRWSAAAAILILFVSGYLIFESKKSTLRQARADKIAITHDVKAPTNAKATITLANGKQIVLDSAVNGTLATQNNINLIKTADGKIEYSRESSVVSRELVYNTLTNPRGSKVIDMILADGSHVWLNAGSSVTYPVAFIGDERKVNITGEAYFEITHDASKPFIVSKGDMNVTVLGTHFNVNAYDDEDEIKVTLLEGSVKVADNGQTVTIKPGQQAEIAQNDKINVANNINLDEVTAWKEGLFHFESAALPDILKQFARWYDIDVSFEGKIPTDKFFVLVNRNSSLVSVLKALQASGIKFQIENKKLIVTK